MDARLLRKSGIALAFAAAALAAVPATAQTASPVDVAGRQRMLSQRIVKAYCQIGLGVLPAMSRRQLTDAIAMFEQQLRTLEGVAADAEARDALRSLGRVWISLRTLALARVERAKARQLNERAEQVLDAAQRTTLAVEAADPNSGARLVNLAGRQRMLSQRLAKLYMLSAWTGESGGYRAQSEAARAEFTAALATLRASPQNTPELEVELDAVQAQWTWFEMALALEGAHAYGLLVADASEAIVNSMERITQLYGRLAAARAPAGAPPS